MKLSKPQVLGLDALLTASEGVQLNVTMSHSAHAVLTMAVLVMLGAGIQAITPTAFLGTLPAHVATLLSSTLGALLVLMGTLSVSPVVNTAIAVVVAVATALGVGPEPPIVATVRVTGG